MANYRGVEIDLQPTADMRQEAAIGLEWRDEYGRGGTAVGVGTANAILSGSELSPERVRRMYAYFERHAVDRDAPGFTDDDSENFPSAGKIAWLLWGGDSGRAWSTIKRDQLMRIDDAKSHDRQLSLRQMPCEFKAKDAPRTFEGYGSVYGVIDSYGDIVEPGAFAETLRKSEETGIMPAMLWQHNAMSPIGVWTAMHEDDYGLHVMGQLADTTLGNEAYTLMKMGALSGLSIGYSVVTEEYDRSRDARLLKKINLWEVSPVTFPANGDARVAAVKATDSSYRGLERILRDVGFSRSESKLIASRGLGALREAEATDSVMSDDEVAALVARFKC
jgi:HK97 family phage prohead protease